MKHLCLSLLLISAAASAQSDPIGSALDNHILPRMEALSVASQDLASVAADDCAPTSADLRAAFGKAFDAWITVSHLRFGPTETDNRAFAMAYWPDSKGFTPKALSGLLRSSDPAIQTAEGFANVSIAARGFYAMEFLLYDPGLSVAGSPDYHCQLVQRVAQDIARTAEIIHQDWQDNYATLLRTPGPDGRYRTEQEAKQELYKSLLTGLQLTADMRLGRPLGSFDRPRPKRAEARRSQRSKRHIVLAVDELEELALMLAREGSGLQAELAVAFEATHQALDAIASPDLSSVTTPFGWLQADIVRLNLHSRITEELMPPLGEELGVPAGFNALDGD
jgi:predicted lipoprotein